MRCYVLTIMWAAASVTSLHNRIYLRKALCVVLSCLGTYGCRQPGTCMCRPEWGAVLQAPCHTIPAELEQIKIFRALEPLRSDYPHTTTARAGADLVVRVLGALSRTKLVSFVRNLQEFQLGLVVRSLLKVKRGMASERGVCGGHGMRSLLWWPGRARRCQQCGFTEGLKACQAGSGARRCASCSR